MGQSSSPLLNKYGNFMYWNSMWDDKFLFTRKLKEDIFINMFLPLVFNKSLSNSIKLTDFKNDSNYLTLPEDIKLTFKKTRNDFFLKKNFLKTAETSGLVVYSISGKIWILRFQGWLIIVFSLYTPKYAANISVSRLQLLKNSQKKNSKWWYFLRNNLTFLKNSKLPLINKSLMFVPKKKKSNILFRSFLKKRGGDLSKFSTFLKNRFIFLKFKKLRFLEKKKTFFFKRVLRQFIKEAKFVKITNVSSKKLRVSPKKLFKRKAENKFQTWQFLNNLNFQASFFFKKKSTVKYSYESDLH